MKIQEWSSEKLQEGRGWLTSQGFGKDLKFKNNTVGG